MPTRFDNIVITSQDDNRVIKSLESRLRETDQLIYQKDPWENERYTLGFIHTGRTCSSTR